MAANQLLTELSSEIMVSPPSSEQLYRYDLSSDTVCFPGTSVFTPKDPESFSGWTSLRFDFQKPVKSFSLHMRDFGDANPTNEASGTVEVVGYNQLNREVTRVEVTQEFQKNIAFGPPNIVDSLDDSQDAVDYPTGNGNSCEAPAQAPGNVQFQLNAPPETFLSYVRLSFLSMDSDMVSGLLADPGTAWGNLCYSNTTVAPPSTEQPPVLSGAPRYCQDSNLIRIIVVWYTH